MVLLKIIQKTEEFGLGNPDGVIAPETANNGTTGGAMVPMLTLGIPGSPTAIMIGLYISMVCNQE